MAYLNNIYGNAAYTGFIAGSQAGRQAISAVAADYLALKTAAQQFAIEVDALIVFDALVTTGAGITQLAITTNTIAANEQWRAGLLHDLCAAYTSGNYDPTKLAAGYAVAAAAIFAQWTELVAGLVTP